VRDACETLQARGFSVFAAHQSRRAVDFREVDYTKPAAVLLGGEVWGVSATAAALADAHITVPMLGMVSSLNVSVAAAVVMYEALRQRQAAGLYDRSRLDSQTYTRLLFEWAYPRIARRCRETGLDYPRLDADGDLVDNPFAANVNAPASRRARTREDVDGQSDME
jgi:tRNA (guanosine-2'-O-)-methyltransferase